MRSATRSEAVSMPTERRMRAGSTSSGEPATGAWLMRPGCSASDSTAPRGLGQREQVGAGRHLQRRLLPATSVTDTIAPGARIGGSDLVPRVVGQAGPPHPSRRMGDQRLDDGAGVGDVAVHAHGRVFTPRWSR